MDKIQALRRGNGIQIPLLLKKLFAMDTCWEMKKKYSSVKWQWYQQNSWAISIPRSSLPRQNGLKFVFVCLFFISSYLGFFLLIFIFIFLIWREIKKESESGLVRKWEDSRMSWERTKIWSNMLYNKFLNKKVKFPVL